MASMKFYSGESMREEKMMKINLAPLTSSACESNLGDLTQCWVKHQNGNFEQQERHSEKNSFSVNEMEEQVGDRKGG